MTLSPLVNTSALKKTGIYLQACKLFVEWTPGAYIIKLYGLWKSRKLRSYFLHKYFSLNYEEMLIYNSENLRKNAFSTAS